MRLPIFGRKSRPTPVPSVWPELVRASLTGGSGPVRSYDVLVRDAYLKNPIAQRAVRIVAEGAAGAPVRSNPPDHPALGLLGGGEPGPALIETIAANLLLHGNAYVEVGLGASGLPVALYSLRPERVAGVGLDCIGVALVAAAAAGCAATAPVYALGGDHETRLDAAVAALGCAVVTEPRPGDLLVLAPGMGRRHLAVLTDCGVVHAHAGVGRVVEGPCDPAWTLVAAWRFPED